MTLEELITKINERDIYEIKDYELWMQFEYIDSTSDSEDNKYYAEIESIQIDELTRRLIIKDSK